MKEADFQCRALETVQGLTVPKVGKAETRASGYREPQRTFFGRFYPRSEPESQGQRSCRVCNKSHGVWTCGEFKQMDVSKRWELAKTVFSFFR